MCVLNTHIELQKGAQYTKPTLFSHEESVISCTAWHIQICQNNHSLTFPDFFIFYFFILPVLFAFILLCEFYSFPFYNFNLR